MLIITTDPGVDSTRDSGTGMTKQLGFISALPSDIVFEIFEYLNQRDCLACLTVCHDWYNIIPQYTQGIWKELRLDTRHASGDYQRLGRCLGRHVKHVIISRRNKQEQQIEQEQLHSIMRKLIDWECIEVESFELECGITAEDQTTFVDLLQQLAPQLTHLRLVNHMSLVNIMHLICALPEVTHFTCYFSEALETDREVAVSANIPIEYVTKIINLQLDAWWLISKQQRESLLKRCPNLQCYIDPRQDQQEMIDLDEVFQYCPKIKIYSAEHIEDWQHEKYLAYMNNNLSGLRCFHVVNSIEFHQVAHILDKYQGTLEHLSIFVSDWYPDWPNLSELVQLPNLRTLIYHASTLDANSFRIMLNHSPRLETVDLYLYSSFLHLTLNTLRSLHVLHSLRYFTCHSVVLNEDLSLLTLLERFPALEELVLYDATLSPNLPRYFESPKHLKYLELGGISWNYDDDDDDQEATIVRFFKCLTASSKLQVLKLTMMVISGPDLLMEISSLSTLNHLEVQLGRDLQGMEEVLLEFIKTLQNAVIKTLKIFSVFGLSFDAAAALADLPYLTTLCIGGDVIFETDVRVNKKGFLELLQKSSRLDTFMIIGQFVLEDGNQQLEHSHIVSLVGQIQASKTPGTRSQSWDVQHLQSHFVKSLRRYEDILYITNRIVW
ncbi:hypothetical protein BJV82DRAFT_320772 [Fennellomyces sp. T-0311]|nr:hypothetical protein BJV82DRAFT_320772 [Fennellomyces sp. T-0311]